MTHTRTRSSADKKLFIAFLALLVCIPLPLGSNRPWAWNFMEVIIFSLCFWWLVLFMRQHVSFSLALKQSHGVFLCLGGFALVIALQLIPLPIALVEELRSVDKSIEPASWLTVSIDPVGTWWHLRATLAFIAMVFLLLNLVNTVSRVKLLAIAILVSGVFQGAYGSLMTLSGAEYGFIIKKWTYIGNATGTFVNRNHFANYLILALAMGTGLLLSDVYQGASKTWAERRSRVIELFLGDKFKIRVGLAVMVIALVLTRSRMGNMAFFVGLLLSGFVWLLLTKRITKGTIILLVSLVLVDSFIVGAWFGFDQLKQRMEATTLTQETRDEVVRDSWVLIKDQPLLGSGAGSFYTAFPKYRQGDIRIYYDHAHNDYIQFVVEHGIMGFIFLLVFVLLALKHSVVAMMRRKTLMFQAMAFAPLMSIIAMALHSAVDFSLQIPANAATFTCILTLGWILRYMPSNSKRKQA